MWFNGTQVRIEGANSDRVFLIYPLNPLYLLPFQMIHNANKSALIYAYFNGPAFKWVNSA
jgi:hypothetical protein